MPNMEQAAGDRAGDDAGLPLLSDEERATYPWQMWIEGLGEAGQRRLKGASVLVSRCGGVGGTVAYCLAAAGVGRLILAHAGNLRADDLNRQLLMTHGHVGKPRIDSAAKRLAELNPRVEIVAVGENVGLDNAAKLVGMAEVVVDCAPLFAERFAMNDAAVAQGRPMVDVAMFGLEMQMTTIMPGASPCLRCLYPSEPAGWRRQFPVLAAVSSTAGAMAAMEAVKLITGIGEPLASRMLYGDLGSMRFRTVGLQRRAECPVCGHL